jgi:hypothetical protein
MAESFPARTFSLLKSTLHRKRAIVRADERLLAERQNLKKAVTLVKSVIECTVPTRLRKPRHVKV